MLKKYGFIRVGAISNKIEVGNVNYNVQEILKCLENASEKGVEIVSFPLLSLTGCSCGDLFFSDDLLSQTLKGIITLKNKSRDLNLVFIVGAPLKIDNYLYNCAISISRGKILGVTPKTYISNINEFNESRYFNSALDLKTNTIIIDNEEVKVSNLLIYKCNNYDFVNYSIDLGEDLITNNSISNYTSLLGSNLIFNLTSDVALVNSNQRIKELIEVQAYKNLACYVYCSSNSSESTSHACFSSQLVIGDIEGTVKESNELSFESKMIYADIDLKRINNQRLKRNNYKQSDVLLEKDEVLFDLCVNENQLLTKYEKLPFLVNNQSLQEILDIQTYGLAKRIKHLSNAKMIVGVSGGSDSTLAFLIALRVAKLLNMDNKDIIGVTMPGFGTSKRTYNNAIELIKCSGATLKEISIVDACIQHYKDIGHDINDYDVTYENAQARERTQILFDLANDCNGIVVGSGDLSELVLGWATYNGDQMSNYGVNTGIPKTIVLALINKIKEDSQDSLKCVLENILNTPISPELLPLDEKGNIVQDSQKSIGPYRLHDFFIYHFFKYGYSLEKLYYLACLTFKDEYTEVDIKNTLTIFIKRLFTQQFKRSALSDGIKVFDIGVSLHDFKFNSDLVYTSYLQELEKLK